jgi:hypothetical protein
MDSVRPIPELPSSARISSHLIGIFESYITVLALLTLVVLWRL